jgi:nuclear transport factor 2 (NTF2) superfamily protein
MNYLGQDAPEIQFAAKEVCRDMARPNQDSWRKLKILARFVFERESVRWRFEWQDEVDCVLRSYSDSDWAGCRRTRRSTSGGVVMLGGTV